MNIKQQLEQVIANLHEHADQLNQLVSDLNATSVWHKAKDIEEIVIPRLSAIVEQMDKAEPTRKCHLALPKITDEIWEDYNETSLMTWKDGGPHWTQLAVDFACLLKGRCLEQTRVPIPRVKYDDLLERSRR